VVVLTSDDVGAGDFANLGEELNELVLVGIDGKTTDKDRATVQVVLAEELLVGVRARDEGLLLHIERVDAEAVILADSLRENVRMKSTRSDVRGLREAYRVEIALGIKLGELDQDRRGQTQDRLDLRGEQLALAELPVQLEDVPGLVDGDVVAKAAVNNEGAYRKG
jgi:hypothetical protein